MEEQYNNQQTRRLPDEQQAARQLSDLRGIDLSSNGQQRAVQAQGQALPANGQIQGQMRQAQGQVQGQARQVNVQAQPANRPTEAQVRQRRQASAQGGAQRNPQADARRRQQANVPASAQAYQRVNPAVKTHGKQAKKGYVPAGAAARYSTSAAHYGYQKKRTPVWKAALITVLVLALLGFGGFFIYKELRKQAINNDLRGDKTEEELAAIQDALAPPVVYSDPFVMLLIGSDARVEDESMGQRSDTNILVRVDPAENTVSLVSIPRDTMIYIDGAGTNKFNAAYFYGGVAGTINAVKNLCGVDVNHYAEIDFDGMIDLVDAVGGIDVYVEEEIDDEDAGGYIPAGYQHLDGEDTLVFARSRAYYDGDFTRQANQRKVITALAYKLLESPASDLLGLIEASTSFLTTDMTVDDIKSIADQMRHNEKDIVIYSAMIPAYAAMVGDVSYVIAEDYEMAEMMEAFMRDGNVGGNEAEEEESEEESSGEESYEEEYSDETYSEEGSEE